MTSKQAVQPAHPSPVASEEAPDPVALMRAAAAKLLAEGAPLPRFDDLTELMARLRITLLALIPQVENAARKRADEAARKPPENAARKRAEDYADRISESIKSARACLDAGPGPGLVSAKQHALSLAREVAAMCRHFEELTGACSVDQA